MPPAAGRPNADPIARIALCNLDSLASRAAIQDLFAALPGRIGLVSPRGATAANMAGSGARAGAISAAPARDS